MDRREMDAARRMGDAVRDMLENVDRWAAAYHRLHGQSVGNDYLAREAREALERCADPCRDPTQLRAGRPRWWRSQPLSEPCQGRPMKSARSKPPSAVEAVSVGRSRHSRTSAAARPGRR
jgi:hypothetical protein